MRSTFQIRLEAIESNNRENTNLVRLKTELKDLATDIGRKINESDTELMYLYRRIKQEISFLSTSNI